MSARGWALFAAVSVIWGMPYLFIKIAVDELSPSVVAWSRLALAASVLLPVAWKLGALRGLGERWRILTLFAAVEMAVPWPLIGYGEVHISSSLAAILIAAVPLFVALLALRFDHAERPTASRLAGMLIGIAGVAALVGIDIRGRANRGAVRGRDRVDRRARPDLLRARLPLLLPADRGGGAEPRDGDHLREPRRGAGAGRCDPRREHHRRRGGRPAADPRRLVAVH